jgi:hypothetical protein
LANSGGTFDTGLFEISNKKMSARDFSFPRNRKKSRMAGEHLQRFLLSKFQKDIHTLLEIIPRKNVRKEFQQCREKNSHHFVVIIREESDRYTHLARTTSTT